MTSNMCPRDRKNSKLRAAAISSSRERSLVWENLCVMNRKLHLKQIIKIPFPRLRKF